LDSLQDYSVSGSPRSLELKGILDTLINGDKKMMELRKEFTLVKSGDSAGDNRNNEILQKILSLSASEQTYKNNFIDTVSDPVVAIFAFNVNFSEDSKKFESLSNRLLKQYADNEFVKDYVTYFNQRKQQIEESNASKFKIGDEVPDISLPDPDGKMISLSSLKGKYVLLDFWASWCQPCRHENPEIVKLYNKYKDKGFTIYSVSLDDNKDHWLTAISYDKLSWPTQVSELKGWDSKVVTQFNINEIPHNFLLDPQGKVLAVNLHDKALENALSTLIK
jgi:peroxiredoxin